MIFGTCMLLRWRHAEFLVTAAHMIDHHPTTSLYIGTIGRKPVQLWGEMIYSAEKSGDRKKDPYDFALAPLRAEIVNQLGNVQFIDESQLAPADRDTRGPLWASALQEHSNRPSGGPHQRKAVLVLEHRAGPRPPT